MQPRAPIGIVRGFASTSPLQDEPFSLPKRVDRRYEISPYRKVPPHIARPPYAETGKVPSGNSFFTEEVLIHDQASITRMRAAAQLARQVLDKACKEATVGRTTDEIDEIVHNAICDAGAYPSPLNYAGFPKSLCASVNEVICHGIPSVTRELQYGDVVSFDVSCFLDGVHGDNCATIIVGDEETEDGSVAGKDWRGVPYRVTFDSEEEQAYFEKARLLVKVTRESLFDAIDVCKPGACLSDIGGAIQDKADAYNFSTVEKYRGHGIGEIFHCAPYVKHFRNNEKMELRPGMIFTIEPMLCMGSARCFEWEDDWTVATLDNSPSAQFEHTILITEGEPEILTLPEEGYQDR